MFFGMNNVNMLFSNDLKQINIGCVQNISTISSNPKATINKTLYMIIYMLYFIHDYIHVILCT